MVDPVNPAIAAGRYANVNNIGPGVSGGVDAYEGASFGDLVGQGIKDSVEIIRSGEIASADAMTGDADLTAVVQAVTEAEMTLQTIVATRDRVIAAYQEIMRMPI